MQAQAGASRTEDSARTAYEELMEEEDQAAAKAAAKKAKKLKQKAKKQQATVQTDETVLHPESENELEYDQFSLPHSATSAAPETSASSEAASQATSEMPSALSVFGALHTDNDAQSSASARAVCSTDAASGEEAYNLPLLNSQGVDQSEAAVATEQVASVQGGDGSSGSRQSGVAAGAHNADEDAQFLQALFCCPITKVINITRRRHAAFKTCHCCSLWLSWCDEPASLTASTAVALQSCSADLYIHLLLPHM